MIIELSSARLSCGAIAGSGRLSPLARRGARVTISRAAVRIWYLSVSRNRTEPWT